MPTAIRSLPENPHLEHLKSEAKGLLKRVKAHDNEALELVRHIDPRADTSPDFSLANAQLIVARSYGFARWALLKDHVQFVTDNSRWPEPAADDAPADPAGLADHLLQLGCLNYTQDRVQTARRAQDLLTSEPDLATANVFTMAATGAAEDMAELLTAHPELANSKGGPFDWSPLLYLAYGRLGDAPGRSAARTAQALLAAGADPNAGFLWQGMTSPFTVLTGVFGGGEQDQPVHPDSAVLARLLLEAGADPNDNQALYNRMFRPADDHLELLFEFGLGREFPSEWRRRLEGAGLLNYSFPTPNQMVTEQLFWAAGHGMPDRIRLLLAHDVDPDGLGYHPNHEGQTAYQMAVLAGFPDIADLLAEAGADTSVVDTVDVFLGACLNEDRQRADSLIHDHPGLAEEGRARHRDAVARAATLGKLEAVRLLLDHGFDPRSSSPTDQTALHHAAVRGHEEIVDLLLEHGADPTVVESFYNATPAGWAQHAGHTELAEKLRRAEQSIR